MPVFWIILIVLALAALGYAAGRRRAVASVNGDIRKLHSLPAYYGWNVVVLTLVPALVALLLWVILQPLVIEAQVELPMAKYWGAGETASSDGQFFDCDRFRCRHFIRILSFYSYVARLAYVPIILVIFAYGEDNLVQSLCFELLRFASFGDPNGLIPNVAVSGFPIGCAFLQGPLNHNKVILVYLELDLEIALRGLHFEGLSIGQPQFTLARGDHILDRTCHRQTFAIEDRINNSSVFREDKTT